MPEFPLFDANASRTRSNFVLKKINLLLAPSGDHPSTALLLLLAGVILLALQDSLIKFISDSTSFWQIQTLRSAGNMSLVFV